jgi:cell shape-determining protein MreC
MTYLSGKAQQKRKYIHYGVSFIIFIMVVFFWPRLRPTLFGVIEPALVGYGSVKESMVVFPEFFSTYLVSHKKLVTQQKELEQEIENLENALADKDALLREKIKEEIDTPLSSAPYSSTHIIVMYPLMEDISKIYSTLLLSKGYKDGIIVGATVYLRGNQAVCTIKEVYTSSSVCQLLTAFGQTVEGVTSSSSITLSLVGRGGHFLANIARDTPVAKDEIVYLRSNPKMILGKITHVANNNQDTSWHVFVEGAYNPITSSIFYVQP